ncbi:MAG: RluA family pseudouridine synthase [Burkholderiaceae bacterium]
MPEKQVRQVAIEEAAEGQRLDNFLARLCGGVPKSHLYRLIRQGQVRVNGRRAKPESKLAYGDLVRVPPVVGVGALPSAPSPMYQRTAARLARRLAVVYEDDGLLVVDKPAGTAVHGGSGVTSGAIEQLRALHPQARFLELVHRLDRDTSGLLMVARRRSVLRDLHEALRLRRIRKRYLAVVLGEVPARWQTVRLPLSRTLTVDGERRVRPDPDGLSAVTHVRGLGNGVLRGVGPVSLVGVRLETGRTHQIRVHMACIGHPLLGDVKYGDFAKNRLAAAAGHGRLFLHAARLGLRHPREDRELELEAALPEEFVTVLAQAGIDAGLASRPADTDV